MYQKNELITYFGTRFPLLRFVPLAAFLVVSAYSISDPMHTIHIVNGIFAFVMAFLLILQFRLWDDIADRSSDQLTHPTRVLCQTQVLWPFYLIAIFLFVTNIILLVWHNDVLFRPLVFLALSFGLFAWYYFRSESTSGGLTNSQIVLIKYSVIVWLLSHSNANIDMILLVSVLLSVHLIFSIFEILDDQKLRHLPNSFIFLVGGIVMLVCVWAFVMYWTKPHENFIITMFWYAIILSTLVKGAVSIFNTKQQVITQQNNNYFIIALIAYFTINFEQRI